MTGSESTPNKLQAMCSWSMALSWDWYRGIALDDTFSFKGAAGIWEIHWQMGFIWEMDSSVVLLIMITSWGQLVPVAFLICGQHSIILLFPIHDVYNFIQFSKYWLWKFDDIQSIAETVCDLFHKWRGVSISSTWRASWSSRPPWARTSAGSPSTTTILRA